MTLLRTYLAREEGVRYDWRAGLAAGIAVGVPAVGGVALGQPAAGVLAALAAWLLLRTTARGSARERMIFLGRRCLLMTAGLVVGMLCHGWAAIPAVALAALGAPIAAVGPFPALCVVIGAQLHSGQVVPCAVLFLGGSLFAALFLLIPSASGSTASDEEPTFGGGGGARALGDGPAAAEFGGRGQAQGAGRIRAAFVRLRREAREGTPRFRYAIRLSVSITVAYVAMTALHVTGAQLVVIGIVTTLLPSWAHTTRRVAKRIIGTIFGCLLAAALLAFAAGLSPYVPVLAVAILTAVGQPLRQINYGFFAITSSPIALLLTDFTGTVGWREALERSTYNAAGAVLAVLATLLIWPSREEKRLPARLNRLLESHNRLLDQSGPKARLAAEATALDLDAARRRLALQRKPSPELRAALAATAAAAQKLRVAVAPGEPQAGLDPRTIRRVRAEPAPAGAVDTATEPTTSIAAQLAVHVDRAVLLSRRPESLTVTL